LFEMASARRNSKPKVELTTSHVYSDLLKTYTHCRANSHALKELSITKRLA
jgi:hypothetical protein